MSRSAPWSFFLLPLSPTERKCCYKLDSLLTTYCGTGNNCTDVCLIGTWNSREDFWNSRLAYEYQVRILFCFTRNVLLNVSASFLSWRSLYRNPGKYVFQILKLCIIKLWLDGQVCWPSHNAKHVTDKPRECWNLAVQCAYIEHCELYLWWRLLFTVLQLLDSK